MRFYKPTTKYCCGVDLHSRNIYVCVVDRDGDIHCHRSLRSNPPRRFTTPSADYLSDGVEPQ